ncbi:MAG TPA: ATP-binding protein, partial [Bacteroidia bacterium]|nr:ATP-binding protein [Bacteroidia bacterium]
IPASEIGRVTEMFFRATEKVAGGGLGLYVAQRAMDRMGGVIEIQSVMDSGTEVVLRVGNMVG